MKQTGKNKRSSTTFKSSAIGQSVVKFFKRTPNAKKNASPLKRLPKLKPSIGNAPKLVVSKEHSSRHITYSYLRNHFLVSFFLIFLFPVLDLIVLLPSEWELPLAEYWLALGLSLLHSLLAVISFADIYQDEAYLMKEMRSISRTSAFCGIAASEFIMAGTQVLYIYYAWPYFQLKFYGLLMYLSEGRNADLMVLIKHFRNEMGDSKAQAPQLDVDCYVLVLMQIIRTFCIEAKIFLAYSIRAQTVARNAAVGQKYLGGALPTALNQQLMCKLPNFIWPVADN